MVKNESIFIFLANFQMDHFRDLTLGVAAQTVVPAHTGMHEQQCGGAGQLPPRGSPHLCKTKSVIELNLKLILTLQPDCSTTSLYFRMVFFEVHVQKRATDLLSVLALNATRRLASSYSCVFIVFKRTLFFNTIVTWLMSETLSVSLIQIIQ